jgi:hypothetical protein
MDDFLSEVQSDELAECVDYQEWIDLRRLEAIEEMEKEMGVNEFLQFLGGK